MSTYADLIRTNYPNALDDRPTAINPVNRNSHFKVNINFENRTALTSPADYIVFADDVNALQDSIISVQRSLGIMPQGTDINYTVAQRLSDIETFVMYNESISGGFDTLDERYMWGGNRPVIDTLPAPLISIKSHLHDGTLGQATKINLASHVTGLLSKANIDLTTNTSAMLTASDIKMSTSTGTTISQKLEEKFDKTGGLVTGPVVVKGNFTSRTHVELDAKDTSFDAAKGYTESIADSHSDSGYARKAASANQNGYLSNSNVSLRYGNYVAIFRMKVSNNTSVNTICKLGIKDSVTGTSISEVLIRPSDFTSADAYKTFYVEFEHKNINGTSTRGYINPLVYFYTGIADISIDSIIIEPITTALYDDDNF